jgi:hypothetical protein
MRQKLSLAEMRNRILEQTTTALENNARFIAAGLEIKQREGTPNWEANIGVAPGTVHKTFLRVVGEMKRKYDIVW